MQPILQYFQQAIIAIQQEIKAHGLVFLCRVSLALLTVFFFLSHITPLNFSSTTHHTWAVERLWLDNSLPFSILVSLFSWWKYLFSKKPSQLDRIGISILFLHMPPNYLARAKLRSWASFWQGMVPYPCNLHTNKTMASLRGFLQTLYNFNNSHNKNFTKQKNLTILGYNQSGKIFLLSKIYGWQ